MMTKLVDQFGTELNLGDTVIFYNYTKCDYEKGKVTKLDCPVLWYNFKNEVGVEINGSLTRPYSDVVKIEE